MKKHIKTRLEQVLLVATLAMLHFHGSMAQESPKEEDYFKIMKVRAPEGTLLEVGGLVVMPNGNLGISTRRGGMYISWKTPPAIGRSLGNLLQAFMKSLASPTRTGTCIVHSGVN